jgi:two-component system sensor histidine kinase FlrB
MEHRGQQLEQAFRAFSAMSGQLEQSYRYLQERVVELTHQLETVRAERHVKAQQAEQLAERLELLLATLPAGVIVLDTEGRIQMSNPAARKILGFDPMGDRWIEVARQAFELASASNGDSITSDGKRVTILASALSGDAGRILLLTDVTERRALETLVNRNDRLGAMGKMAASLAHQIRTPLATALLYLTQCRKAPLPEKYGVSLERGIERLHDMDRLVRDMLVFARGGGPGERVRVADLFKDVAAGVAGILPEEAQLEIDEAHGTTEIEGNRSTLVAALTNLVGNAFEAAADAHVTLSAEERGGRIVLNVSDSGPGIPDTIRQRVLEPFFSTRSAGTGLGLAVAKTVAEAHGGRLQLDSEVGRGTTIGLELPVRIAHDGDGEAARESIENRDVA